MVEKITAANDVQYQGQACRTLPIPFTITPISGYPAKLKIYLTNASRYWQVRCFFQGRVRTQSLRTTNKREAIASAKSYYEKLLASYYAEKLVWDPEASPKHQFETLIEKLIAAERDRVQRGELSKMTFINNVNRLRKHWLPLLGNQHIQNIRHADIQRALATLSKRGISSISLSQYLQSLRAVFKLAYTEQLINNMPIFPTVKKTSTPRGGFTVAEYHALVQAARRASNVVDDKPATHRNRAGGIYTRTASVPRELPWLIGFMVNGFMRPSDIIHIKHKHVEIIRAEYIYLRLTLPETKRHKTPIVTLQPAVRIYEKLKKHMASKGFANPDDYLFLPDVRTRSAAGPILAKHFIYILEKTGLRKGVVGQARTLYSLRHTAIMFRLLYGKGIDLLTLARNARTSIQMIERFYASQLTAEMNIDLLQSRRSQN